MSEDHDLLLRKMDSIAALTEEDRSAVRGLSLSIRTFEAHQPVVLEGDRPSACGVMLEGLVCSTKLTAGGARQIASFHVPGDWPDLQALHMSVVDYGIMALSRSRIAFIPHREVLRAAETYPRLAGALWRETLIAGSIYREWVLNLGQRDGLARVAHIFCEMFERLSAVGLAGPDSYRFGISQSELGEAAGLSAVHVNRVLQELRAAGLIEFRGGVVRIPDWERLKQTGDFNPAYLHQKSPRHP